MENSNELERTEYLSYRVHWQGIWLEIRHCPYWLSAHGDGLVTQHVEVRNDNKQALPITETGYRSHFLHGDEALVEFDDDPVAFVLWWLNDAALSKAWLDRVESERQLALF